MIDFISESFVVVENDRASEMFVFVFRVFDFEVESIVIIHIFLSATQFFIIGYMDDVQERFIRDVVVSVCVVVRQRHVFAGVMVGELLPSGYGFVLFVIRQFVQNNENLKIGIPFATYVGRFAEHIFEIIVGILKIVLHDEFYRNTADDSAAFFDGNVRFFVDISARYGTFAVISESLRLDFVFCAEFYGKVAGYGTMQRFQFLGAAGCAGLNECLKRVRDYLQKCGIGQWKRNFLLAHVGIVCNSDTVPNLWN